MKMIELNQCTRDPQYNEITGAPRCLVVQQYVHTAVRRGCYRVTLSTPVPPSSLYTGIPF